MPKPSNITNKGDQVCDSQTYEHNLTFTRSFKNKQVKIVKLVTQTCKRLQPNDVQVGAQKHERIET